MGDRSDRCIGNAGGAGYSVGVGGAGGSGDAGGARVIGSADDIGGVSGACDAGGAGGGIRIAVLETGAGGAGGDGGVYFLLLYMQKNWKSLHYFKGV